MLELKESRYNYRLPYDDQVLYFNGMTRQFIPVPRFLQDIVNSFLSNPDKALEESPAFLKKLQSTGLLINKSVNELEVIRERHHHARNEASYQLVLTFDEPFVHLNHATNALKKSHQAMSEKVKLSIKRHLDRYVDQHPINQLRLEWFGEGLQHYLQHDIKEIAMYAANMCRTKQIDFQIGLTTHSLSLQEQDVALLKTLPLRSIRLLLDLSSRGNHSISETGALTEFISHLKSLVTLFPNVLFVLLIHSDLDRLNFSSLVQLMNEQFSTSERNNISMFVHDDLFSLRHDGTSMREAMLQSLRQSNYNLQWEDLIPMLCSGEKKHTYTMYGEGSVGKCVAAFNQPASGYVTTHGNVFWDETTISMDGDIPLFENMRCLSCKHLPLCMGQCIPVQRVQREEEKTETSDCLLPPWGISPESAIRNYCSTLMERYVDEDRIDF